MPETRVEVDHYTAILEVNKVAKVFPPTNARGYVEDGYDKNPVRGVQEVEKFVIRANSIADIQRKLAARVALIEE